MFQRLYDRICSAVLPRFKEFLSLEKKYLALLNGKEKKQIEETYLRVKRRWAFFQPDTKNLFIESTKKAILSQQRVKENSEKIQQKAISQVFSESIGSVCLHLSKEEIMARCISEMIEAEKMRLCLDTLPDWVLGVVEQLESPHREEFIFKSGLLRGTMEYRRCLAIARSTAFLKNVQVEDPQEN